MDLLFHSDIVNLLLKTSGGRDRGLILYFGVVYLSVVG